MYSNSFIPIAEGLAIAVVILAVIVAIETIFICEFVKHSGGLCKLFKTAKESNTPANDSKNKTDKTTPIVNKKDGTY